MTDKKILENVMNQRNPLKRVVQPVDIYTNPQGDNTSNKPNDLPPATQTEESTTFQVVKDTSASTNQADNFHKNKIDGVLIRKYTTHLPPAMIKAIKQRALDTDRKDYEVMYEAISRYFAEQ